MIVLDVNVVVSAHRDDHPQYTLVRPWFDELTRSEERLPIPDLVAASFVRIAANRRVFDVPTTLADAFAFINAVRRHPHHVHLTPGPDHFEVFEELCLSNDAGGDLAGDASLAAIAVEQGATLVSLDRDFARFSRLRWSLPGTA